MIAELVNIMQKQSQKQFKEMMEMFKATLNTNSPTPTIPKGGVGGGKKKKCPHCGLEVYHIPKTCFKLEAHAAKRPAGLTSKKRTWRCTEVKSTEEWQPGKVDITKLKQWFFPYLETTGLDPPPHDELSLSVVDAGPRTTSKSTEHWAWPLEQQKAIKAAMQLEANAIDQAITQAMLDSGASKTFVESRWGLQLTGCSNKVVVTTSGTKLQATHTGLLPTRALSKGAREAIVVPGMSQPALMSVSTLANNGYTMVFLPGNDGVDVFRANDVVISLTAPPALQGWRDRTGLWMVPVINDNPITPGLDVAETAMGMYGLPSTKEVARFLHAALGNPTQATLLTAAQHGNLVTFLGLTPQSISWHFPESDKTQKGHIKQTQQGVRSTKIVEADAMLGFKQQLGVKHNDVYLNVFDASKKLMFSNQTGKFPITSAREKNISWSRLS
jgi:hypothetical protein